MRCIILASTSLWSSNSALHRCARFAPSLRPPRPSADERPTRRYDRGVPLSNVSAAPQGETAQSSEDSEVRSGVVCGPEGWGVVGDESADWCSCPSTAPSRWPSPSSRRRCRAAETGVASSSRSGADDPRTCGCQCRTSYCASWCRRRAGGEGSDTREGERRSGCGMKVGTQGERMAVVVGVEGGGGWQRSGEECWTEDSGRCVRASLCVQWPLESVSSCRD